ncbi:MAG: 1-acyl-sn-glycerol-3-phosphate acyltransferase [Betaproteobacteria bacterium]|nr:1-acyl-sn-glycerol-3-phosphate acyltransferase [Betaproteobacteria bacterium]
MKSAGRLWRSLVTALSFVAFGVGGTLMSAVLMPLLMLVPGTTAVRRARARTVIGFCFRLLVRMLVGSGCMRLETEGVDRLTRAHGTLVLANHPTYIDVVVLISLMPQANCVVKGALWRNPFYWGIVRAAGYVNNDSPEDVINACAESLQSGETLLLFPEGTRTAPGQALRFQRGAAHVALKAGSAVTPALIACDPPTLTKGAPWWLAPDRPFTFSVDVHPAIATSDAVAAASTAIGARHLTDTLEDYFSRELRPYGYA